MLKITACWTLPDKEKIKFFDQEYSIHSCKEIQHRIVYLPENNPLCNEMYVLEFLEYIARLYKYLPEKVLPLVEQQLEISDQAHKKIRSLSKGYRQRVGLARGAFA